MSGDSRRFITIGVWALAFALLALAGVQAYGKLSAGREQASATASPLRAYLAARHAAIEAQAGRPAEPVTLTAQVTAESRSGVRRLRIRDFQSLSDSERDYAGYNLGAGSWDTLVGVLASAVADEFLTQAALRGVALDALDVVFTSRPEDPALAGTRKVRYPRNLGYVAHIDSPASDGELAELRQAVEQASPILNLVSEAQPFDHGKVIHAPSPAQRDRNLPPGLRDFLVEKRAAVLRRQARASAGAQGQESVLSAHAHVEPHTGIRQVRAGEHRFLLLHDSPAQLGGYGLAPTVEEHVIGAAGTCLTHIFEVQAATRQVVLDGLELTIEASLTPRFGKGIDAPSRYRDLHYSVRIESPAPAADIDALREAVEASCPLYNLLKDAQPVEGRIVRGRYAPES